MEVVLTSEQQADQLIREAEAAKARIFPPKGRGPTSNADNFQFIAQIDQDYLVIGSHIDQVTQEKIANSGYVDFSKLLPKDKILIEDDNQLELVIKNGKPYWMPTQDMVSISNFNKWEQAF